MASDVALKYAHAVARHGKIPWWEVEDLAQEIRIALFRWPTQLVIKSCRYATGAYFVSRQQFGGKHRSKKYHYEFVTDDFIPWRPGADMSYQTALLGEVWEFCELIGKEKYLMEWLEHSPDRQALAREWDIAPVTLYYNLNTTIKAIRAYFK